MVSANNTTISSMANSATAFASTITMSANANQTMKRKRIKFLRVQPPANVTSP
jgi:hypothetical protein